MVKKVLGGLLVFSMVLSSFVPAAVVNAQDDPGSSVQEDVDSYDIGDLLDQEQPEEIARLLNLQETDPQLFPNSGIRYGDENFWIEYWPGETPISAENNSNPQITYHGVGIGDSLEEIEPIMKSLGWEPPRSEGTFYLKSTDTRWYGLDLEASNGIVTSWVWWNWVEGDLGETPFTDVPYGAWFYDSVVYVYKNWIMTGLDSRTFGPSEMLSRAQFATILYRMEGEPDVSGLAAAEFPDAPDGIWYDDAVTWASASGIITGYTEGAEAGTFGASDAITRAQMATMMYRYAEYKGYDITTNGDLLDFPDAGEIPDFAADGMLWAVDNGIITGDESEEVKMLKPQNTASRAVGATIITRFLDQIA